LAIPVLLLSACGSDSSDKPRKPRSRSAHLVEIVTARRQSVSLKTTRTGTLKPERIVRIFNQEEGRVVFLPHRPGDKVRKADILLRLDDALLRAEFAKASATRKQAQLNLSRIRRLVRKRLSSDDELTRARTALTVARAEESLLRTRLGYTVARAPFSGVITERKLEPGDIAPRYTHILTLIDPASLITEVDISELFLPHLKKGSPVRVRIDALGSKVFTGRILRIHPDVNPRTRQGRIEIRLDPVPQGARGGQLCRVTLSTPHVNRVMVPFGALRRDQKGQYLYTIANGKARQIYVTTGVRLGNRVSILTGLKADRPVIIRGFLGLKHGKKVKAVNVTGGTRLP
jgi:membrane fusion protein (multidrug efflux system)